VTRHLRWTELELGILLAAGLTLGCNSDSNAPVPLPPVTVTGLGPASGPVTGGTSVTITGINFIDVTSVTIGGSEVGSRTVLSPTQISGTTPASATTGSKDVVVTSSSHSSDICSGCFTYTEAPPPPPALDFGNVAPGDAHTCGLTDGGAAYCWGADQGGQLGNGATTSVPALVPVPVQGGLTFTSLEVGALHSCGVTAAGAAYCWGSNQGGPRGDGTRTQRSSPGPVSGGLSFASVSVFEAATCGLRTGGAAYCWGQNSEGQLGDGTTENRSSPVPVAGGLSFTLVHAGSHHACGVTSAGDAYCWGQNSAGELGTGTLDASTVPVKVAGQ
jgi:alpha-tubulin suppressor-like RCC1 family protein